MMSTTLSDTLYMAWTIATKDVLDALKNKGSRTNILVIIGMVLFLSWYSNVRPWDKRINTVLYDRSGSSLKVDLRELADGYTFAFYETASRQEMVRTLAQKGMGLSLGLDLPADFDQSFETGGELTLDGSVLWANRGKVAEWEVLYSDKFSELLGRSVRVELEENIVIPPPDAQSTSTNFNLLLAVFWVAVMVIPQLMMEEEHAKTLDALLVSPASAGQVVLGKALSGLFYSGLVGGLSFALNWAYVTNWALALLAFIGTVGFAVGMGLALGSFIRSPGQLNLWGLLINFFLLVPALIALDPYLVEGLRTALSLLPTTALAKLFQFSFSSDISPSQLGSNLAIVIGWTGLIYAAVVWKVRRSDR